MARGWPGSGRKYFEWSPATGARRGNRYGALSVVTCRRAILPADDAWGAPLTLHESFTVNRFGPVHLSFVFLQLLCTATPRALAQSAQANAPPTAADVVLPKLRSASSAVWPPGEPFRADVGVTFSITIGDTGTVTEAQVVESAGSLFDEAARRAVMSFEFEPARKGGKPVAVRLRYRYVFGPSSDNASAAEQPPTSRTDAQAPAPTLRTDAQAPAPTSRTDAQAPAPTSRTDAETHPPPGLSAAPPEAPGVREAPIDDQSYSAVAEVEAPVREVSRHTVEQQDLTKIPGTSGDALRAIEVMPGVGRTGISSGEPLLRGAGWHESRSYIEGATVPLLYHLGGVKSAFNSRLLSRVDLYPGNYSASMGRGVGGVVSARVRDPQRDRLHALAELSVLDSTALVETPVGKDASVAFAARRSNVGFFYDAFAPKSGFSVVAVPTYYDYQGLGAIHLDSRHQLRVMSYGSRDALQLHFANPSDFDPALRDKVDFSIGYHRLQTALRSELSSRVTQHLQVTLGYTHMRQVFGVAHARMGQYDLLSRGEWNVRASNSLRVDLGYDIEALTLTGYYVGNRPPQAEGEVQNGGMSSEAVVDASNINRLKIVRPAAYAELEWHPTQSLLVVPGIRVDRYGDQGAWTIDPRLSARYEVTPRLALKWGIGIYSQNPQYYELLPALGNPRLRPYHAQQASAGLEHRPTDTLSWGLEGFYKHLTDRIVSTPGGTPPYFVNAGTGRIYGAEVFARYAGGRFRGWLAYTLSRSERQDRTDPWRLFEKDQTHILAVTGNYDLGRGWELGGRFRLTSGNPYTPVRSAVFDATTGTYQPINAAPFSARNPIFQQLDVRVEKTWQFTQWKLACFLDVQNVYNAKNYEGFDYSYDYRKREAVAGLPLLPNLGVRGEL